MEHLMLGLRPKTTLRRWHFAFYYLVWIVLGRLHVTPHYSRGNGINYAHYFGLHYPNQRAIRSTLINPANNFHSVEKACVYILFFSEGKMQFLFFIN